MMDVCERCGFPAVQDTAGNWRHAEQADAVFCAIVMTASDLASALYVDGNPERPADDA